MAAKRQSNDEIKKLRKSVRKTVRSTVPTLERILFKPLPVLDHGFVRIVDYMGDDHAVVQAARISYGRGTKRVSDDRALIRYLMRHSHTTPFEMAEIKLHVKLPIFVARQWIRHRTASVNEYSARYSILDKEFYIPKRENLAGQSAANRQGRDIRLQGDEAEAVLNLLRNDANRAYAGYLEMLNEDGKGTPVAQGRHGVARELARINLSLNFYTQWYWKIDLHNFMNFLRLRLDDHAQYEIRAYAEVLLDVLRRWVPLTHDAFLSYRLNAVTLSAEAVNAVRRILAGESVTPKTSGLSRREWEDLKGIFCTRTVIT
jgi:thymidylate synthase (FAD)